jgi:hypothetical protein
MVFDAAKDRNGGKAGLKAKHWVLASMIENFGKTANSFKAIGDQARHGTLRSSDPNQPTQTLEEAQIMIRTILEKWSKELLNAP